MSLLSIAALARVLTARAAMSVRICLPSNSISFGRLVGALAGLGRGGPEPGQVQHPAARGDDLAGLVARGAGVRDLDARRAPRRGREITSPFDELSG